MSIKDISKAEERELKKKINDVANGPLDINQELGKSAQFLAKAFKETAFDVDSALYKAINAYIKVTGGIAGMPLNYDMTSDSVDLAGKKMRQALHEADKIVERLSYAYADVTRKYDKLSNELHRNLDNVYSYVDAMERRYK
jgi:hypothetical protein